MDDTNFEVELRSCQHFLVDSELQRETQSNQLFDRKPQSNKIRPKIRSISQHIEACSETKTMFWVPLAS